MNIVSFAAVMGRHAKLLPTGPRDPGTNNKTDANNGCEGH